MARIMGIVDALATAAPEGLRLADVMRVTNLNKTTAHRLLTSLAAEGLADHDLETGRYFVGMRLLSLASAAKRRFQLAPLIEPVLLRLSRQTQDTIQLIARSGDEAVCLECLEGAFPIKVITLHAGEKRPLGIGAAGIALLAFLPDHEIDRILSEHAAERAEHPFDEIQIRQMIAAARRHGHAYNDIHVFKGMETMTSMASVSVPVRSSSGTPVATINVTAVTQRLAPPRRDNIVATLRREVDSIEAAYGPILDAMEPRKLANDSQIAPMKPMHLLKEPDAKRRDRGGKAPLPTKRQRPGPAA